MYHSLGNVYLIIFARKNFVRGNFRTTTFVRKCVKTTFYRFKNFWYILLERNRARWRSSEETSICSYHVYGYHVCKKIWREAIGEELECDREPENSCDRYAVCVKRSGVIIGHLPRKLSSLFAVFNKAWRSNIMYGDWRAQVLRRSTLWESEPFGSGSPSLGTK